MSYSFSNIIKQSKRFNSLRYGSVVSKSNWDPYYNHFTLQTSSLSGFIEIISRLAIIHESTSFGTLIYRGHSDASSQYRIIPTIGRKEYSIEYIENLMVNEMINLRPEEFDGIKSDFDLLSKLQHFGLPTRILDFTYNPLIALYFACCDERTTDSRVICTYDTSTTSSMRIVEKICGMYQYEDYHTISLDRMLGGVSQLKKYALYTAYPLIAKPKYSNDRIKHQSAVFMVFPNAVYDNRSMMVIEGKRVRNEDEFRRFPITPEEMKRLEYIRKEPKIYKDSYYVDSKTLSRLFDYYKKKYDDFDSKKEYEIAEKYNFLFHDRFSIVDEIQELSDETISKSFISILIDSMDRKKIIKDLATIGIDKAFIFPELEYTAELVKNWYFISDRIH